MSQYLEFYLRNGDKFIPLTAYSRSNFIYEIFEDYVPYEKVRVINIPLLQSILNELNEQRYELCKSLSDYEEQIKVIASFNNTVEDKVEACNEVNSMINYCYEKDELILDAKSFCVFLMDIIEENKFAKEGSGIDSDNLIYAGIESGYPTVDSIVEY